MPYSTPPQYIALNMVNAIVAPISTKSGAFLETLATIFCDTSYSSWWNFEQIMQFNVSLINRNKAKSESFLYGVFYRQARMLTGLANALF